MSTPDLIDILESAYQVDQPSETWLTGILRAALSSLDLGAGVGITLSKVDADGSLELEALEGMGFPPEFKNVGAAMHAHPALVSTVQHGYRTWPLCSSFRAFLEVCDPVAREIIDRAYAPFGIRDQLIVHAREPSGIGFTLLIFTKERVRLSKKRTNLLNRIATHFSSAYRLQRRLSQLTGSPAAPIEAVLEPRGRIAHAEPVAQSAEVRAHLGEAVRLREWARGSARREDPDRAVAAWKGLVTDRWTLVDQLESDGKRYVLARENTPAPLGLPDLSARERHVATLAALGRSNKLIAYELDLAHSTVRVLMARAAHKLGVSSRSDLVSRIQTMRHEP